MAIKFDNPNFSYLQERIYDISLSQDKPFVFTKRYP